MQKSQKSIFTLILLFCLSSVATTAQVTLHALNVDPLNPNQASVVFSTNVTPGKVSGISVLYTSAGFYNQVPVVSSGQHSWFDYNYIEQCAFFPFRSDSNSYEMVVVTWEADPPINSWNHPTNPTVLHSVVINYPGAPQRASVPVKLLGDTIWVHNSGFQSPLPNGQILGITQDSSGLTSDPNIHNGCFQPLPIEEFGSTWSEENSSEPTSELSMSPNPAQQGTVVQLTGEWAENAKWQVVDLSGKIVSQGNGAAVQTANLSRGWYVVTADYSASNTYHRKTMRIRIE